jgi:hypothetical protein
LLDFPAYKTVKNAFSKIKYPALYILIEQQNMDGDKYSKMITENRNNSRSYSLDPM